MKCSDFSHNEIVKTGGKICKVISAKGGWITCVPVNKCGSLAEMLDNEIKERPQHIIKRVPCMSCDWPCECLVFG